MSLPPVPPRGATSLQLRDPVARTLILVALVVIIGAAMFAGYERPTNTLPPVTR